MNYLEGRYEHNGSGPATGADRHGRRPVRGGGPPMRRVWTRGIAVLALGVLVTGCATIRPREGFEDVSRLVGERTGQRVYWNQGTAEDSAVAHTVRTLLSDSLAVEQAVQIALLGNRRIQAVYEDLGIAQAELVQAGLLGNPVFSVRGLGHGDGLGVLKYGIAQPFVDLFQIPLRKRVAGAAYESAKHRVASAVFDLAADTRISYYRLQGAL